MKQKTAIHDIIFDFGGVIYDINFMHGAAAFINLGIDDFENMYSRAINTGIFDLYEKGAISSSRFRDALREISGLQHTGQQIDDAWNAILTGFVTERIHLIEKVKNHYNIHLLSNTSEIHYRKFLKEFQEQYGYPDFEALFMHVWISFKMGMRKPSEEIFRFIIKQSKFTPASTLFIDDNLENVVAARRVGINSYYLDHKRNEDILQLFNNEGELLEHVIF
ncbi:MAG: HAD family phosphatase [Bacteroidales bacterium]|nr:HAD family phosphatase [Bacteroidales bacterium]